MGIRRCGRSRRPLLIPVLRPGDIVRVRRTNRLSGRPWPSPSVIRFDTDLVVARTYNLVVQTGDYTVDTTTGWTLYGSYGCAASWLNVVGRGPAWRSNE